MAHSREGGEIGVGECFGIEREFAQGRDGFDGGDGFCGGTAYAILEGHVFHRQFAQVLHEACAGFGTTDLDAGEVLELLEVLGTGIGELLGVPELDELEIRELFAHMAEPLVIETVAVEVDALQFGPAIKLREEVAGIRGSSWREGIQVLQARELFPTRIGGLAEIGEFEVGEIRALGELLKLGQAGIT